MSSYSQGDSVSYFSILLCAMNKCPFSGLFSAKFLAFLCFLLVILQFKMALKCRAEVLFSQVQEGWDTPYGEGIVIVLLDVSSMLINQQYILNKVFLDTNTQGFVLLSW